MAVARITTQESEAPVRREAIPRRRGRPAKRRTPRGQEGNPPQNPPIVTVYFHTDGELHHAWCRQALEFRGMHAGLEIDFFCLHCVEHVTLPSSILSRIPVGPPRV